MSIITHIVQNYYSIYKIQLNTQEAIYRTLCSHFESKARVCVCVLMFHCVAIVGDLVLADAFKSWKEFRW